MFSVSSRALAFSAASRSTVHRPAPKTPTGRPFRDGPSSSSADTPAPQTQKAPDALASGAYMPWWSCVNQNYVFYTINSEYYFLIKIEIPTKIPTFYFRTLEQEAPYAPSPAHAWHQRRFPARSKALFKIAPCPHLRNQPPICRITRGPESASAPASKLGRYRADVC